MPDPLSTKHDHQHIVPCFVTAKCGNKITEGKEGSSFFKNTVVFNFNIIHS